MFGEEIKYVEYIFGDLPENVQSQLKTGQTAYMIKYYGVYGTVVERAVIEDV